MPPLLRIIKPGKEVLRRQKTSNTDAAIKRSSLELRSKTRRDPFPPHGSCIDPMTCPARRKYQRNLPAQPVRNSRKHHHLTAPKQQPRTNLSHAAGSTGATAEPSPARKTTAAISANVVEAAEQHVQAAIINLAERATLMPISRAGSARPCRLGLPKPRLWRLRSISHRIGHQVFIGTATAGV
jgi:hypothetical protein